MAELTRRQFCVASGAGLALCACGGPSQQTEMPDLAAPSDLSMPTVRDMADPSCPVGMRLDAGPATALAVGQVKLFSCAKTFVLRDAAGIYAMTAICTHNGCTVAYTAASHDFACPCHMSTYDLNGNVTAPPAPAPLQHFACSFDPSGNIIVQLDAPVDASTRLSEHD
jgi:Rieske Fe-S protein